MQLPSLRDENGDSETLEITARDAATGAVVKLYYTVYGDMPVMTRSAVVENDSDAAMDLERVYSTCLSCRTSTTTWCTSTASGSRSARSPSARSAMGIQSVASKRGSSSHNHNPFVALKRHGAAEESGEVYSVNLVYSGNFAIDVEGGRLQHDAPDRQHQPGRLHLAP